MYGRSVEDRPHAQWPPSSEQRRVREATQHNWSGARRGAGEGVGFALGQKEGGRTLSCNFN